MGGEITLAWEQDSLSDRESIFEYLYLANPVAAEKTDNLIELSAELLQANPEMGVSKKGWRGRCLILSEVPFNVYYDFDGGVVRIMRVLHQKRQFPI
ncbi:TPA: type II toxin-antitoxin system RelE/ParE family toxin [Yersinia enterocolitica]|uniref:type II toxin-antitoxin system RelE/ParE family toxin n=1 Tax=Yersinia vastinensis TaxID=2890318 RepID=UPI0011A94970|nr:type II toxin-antitoxin system RelE/ParE family toxin [Yersinia vastinensis]HDM8415475.1 type II toxin-antitoxin system RelE/ParE family toxin [Yersinia enterocolitica]